MYDPSEARNRAELIKHLKLYQYDCIDILEFYEGELLPNFMMSEYEAMILGTEVEKDSDG